MHFIFLIIAAIVGIVIGYIARAVMLTLQKNTIERSVSERLLNAREQAQAIIDDAQQRVEEGWKELRATEKQKEQDIKSHEERLVRKEGLLDVRTIELDERAQNIEERKSVLDEEIAAIEIMRQTHEEALITLAGLSKEEARDRLFAEAEMQYQEDLESRSYKLDTQLRETLADRAKNILVTTIQRLAVPTANELTTSTVVIPSDEIKGKVIGKEGRNIRTFERFSGVELLVDETPGAIVVSCFDPVRRAIAVQALQVLVEDGRIQPARIEEELEAAREKIHDMIKEKGAAAVYECGIYNFDPRLVAILGRLHFRTSYGQNVLQHSIEMAHIAEMLAAEVGADTYIAKAGALVHDIGKALDHEFEGTHVEIGIKVLQRFNTDERIITAMKSHHDDVPHETLEAVIVQTADMISGSRPGARRDTAEMYLKRLAELESLAGRFPGIEKVYALQAGREVRIFVHPENVSDFEAKTLARTIAMNIETELRYPGQIKVTIIRETRITDYAR
ncbi:MAG TPA: ribonuclease Y [Candidatus Paceibacterota bacterium]|jgi:ribonuclease Y|nr:ribonuclease Y [Candidatus Paceibacterota bacterium]